MEPRLASQWWETTRTNDLALMGSRMAFQWQETKWREPKETKNKLILNLGWCPNEKKPKEQRINLDRT